MFIQPSLYLAALVFAWFVYWSVPARHYRLRATFLTIFSVCLVSLMVPFLGVALVLSSVVAYSYRFVRPHAPGYLPVGIFIALQVSLMLLPDLSDLTVLAQGFALAGMAYFTLRNIGYLVDVYKQKTQHGLADLLFLNAFFPTYSAGPVENIKTFNQSNCDVVFDASEFLKGVGRILVGILKFYFVARYVIDPVLTNFFPSSPDEVAAAAPYMVLPMIILSWLGLYISFSGYADIAIGSARTFGLKVRENFNFPFLARNIQEFWQRWNISIMNFTSEYIYMNFVRQTGWRIVGLFLVFLAIGIWHHLTVNYVLWGIGHASAMAAFVLLNRNVRYRAVMERARAQRFIAWPLTGLSWLMTISFISFLSAFANAASLSDGFAYLEGLAPW